MKTPKFNSRPCADAVKWLKTQPDAKTAWATCKRGDQMWWALQNLRGALPEKSISVAYARWCAKRAEANAYAAEDAAAADAEDAAAYAYAAATANCAADAADAAYWTARAAYWTARAAPPAVGYQEELRAQADWIREHVPCPIK